MNALRVVAYSVLIVVVVIAPAMAEEPPARQIPGAGSQNVEPFNAEWASLERYECPEWFRDAKLGIYVHWGVYSVPARGCWYGRKMYDERRPEYVYHVDRFGHPSEFGYKDFIPMWKAERFDPDAWLTLFRDAGARYFTPCAVHHDGFDLWDSPHAFNSVKMGPKKNLIKMLKDATDRHGLRWGVTMHFARNGHGIYREGVATLDLERHRLDHLRQDPWQTDDTIGVRYWSYVDGMEYRSVDYLADKFVDIVSKNGNLLLNVPPRADGTFDEQTIRILRELGEWNRRNGEAVFGTRPWIEFGEDDVRFTWSKDGTTLYATFLTWPEDGRAVLTSLAATEDVIDGGIKKVSLLGNEKLIEHRRDAEGLHLMLPQRTNELAVPVKIELEGRLSFIP